MTVRIKNKHSYLCMLCSSVILLEAEDSQGQKVLIIKLHPDDFNWIPLVYSSFSISTEAILGSTRIGDTKGRVDEWNPIKVIEFGTK